MAFCCDSKDGEPTVVVVDLEPMGLGIDVMQVAAKCGRSIFNAFLLPCRPISQQATMQTGFSRSGMNLYVHGVRKHTLTVREAMEEFIKFLGTLGGNVVLVAHAFYHEESRLLKLVRSAGLYDELRKVCVGFSDTLPLFRKMYPYFGNYSLCRLLQELMPDECDEYFPLHNAVRDVRALDRLIKVTRLSDATIIRTARELDDEMFSSERVQLKFDLPFIFSQILFTSAKVNFV